jgi:hypothetical protein
MGDEFRFLKKGIIPGNGQWIWIPVRGNNAQCWAINADS